MTHSVPTRRASELGAPEGFDVDEVFAGGGAGGRFSEFFEGLCRGKAGSGGYSQQQARGAHGPADLRARLAVSLEAVYPGASVRGGPNGKTFDVRVPMGPPPGQVIEPAGQGTAGGHLVLDVE